MTKITDERLAEMVGAGVPCVPAQPGEIAAVVQELRTLRSKPVAGATLSSAIEGLKIVLDAHDEEVRYQASIEGEAAEFWDDIEVKVDDVRVVLAALGAQVSAPTLEPASPQPEAVITDEMVERLRAAIISASGSWHPSIDQCRGLLDALSEGEQT